MRYDKAREDFLRHMSDDKNFPTYKYVELDEDITDDITPGADGYYHIPCVGGVVRTVEKPSPAQKGSYGLLLPVPLDKRTN